MTTSGAPMVTLLCDLTAMASNACVTASCWATAPRQRPAAWPAAATASRVEQRRARLVAVEASASRQLPPITYRRAGGGGAVRSAGPDASAMQLASPRSSALFPAALNHAAMRGAR